MAGLVAGLMGGLSVQLAWAVQAAPPATAPSAEVPADLPTPPQQAFSVPWPELADAERRRFAIGNSFFRRNWVEAPASARARDGLGPLYLARSCAACHLHDGRARPPAGAGGDPADAAPGLVMRLSQPAPPAGHPPRSDAAYGDQLQTAAVSGVAPEGRIAVRWLPVRGRFADGQPYTLQRPVWQVTDLAYGPLAEGTQLSPRIAPQLVGMGLLEAIPEREILQNAADQAAQAGPVKGRTQWVEDRATGRQRVGRFGWKAAAATLMQQTAAAFAGDIGITSVWFPDENCSPVQTDCLAAPRGGGPGQPEIDLETLGQVVFYMAVRMPPPAEPVQTAALRRGERLFHRAGCAQCHRPAYRAETPPLPAVSSPVLAGRTLWPYTDLLLHDMGAELADAPAAPHAPADPAGRLWKTPPLWGLGRLPQVSGHHRLLHDGRADGVLQAVLWHGGEAAASRRQVLAMSAQQRRELVRFVETR